MVFAVFQAEPTPRVVFIHRPTRFAPSLTAGTQWDNHIYGFLGEVQPGNQVNLIEWPETPFGRTAQILVPTLETMDDAWAAAAPATTMLGPFAANQPNKEQLRVRYMCPIPHRYVRLCLTRTLSPRAFWTDVVGQIVADQAVVDCRVVVDFGRFVSTYGPQDAANRPTMPLAGVGVLVAPLADPSLSERRWSWVTEDLPALHAAGATALEAQLLQQGLNLQNVLQQQRADQLADRAAARADKTFSETFQHAAVEIQMLCEVGTDAALPPWWNKLANLKKKEGIAAFTHFLEARAREAGSTEVAPVVTPELFERVSSFKFGCPDVDDIMGGLPIFMMTYGSPKAHSQARERSVVYAMLQAGSAAPSLDQIRELVSNAPQMAQTLLGLNRAYQAYATLLDVILGVQHRVAIHFREALVLPFQRYMPDAEQLFSPAELARTLPLFQRHTQLAFARYFQMAPVLGANTPLPAVQELIEIIAYRRWVSLPQLPPRYFLKAAPTAVPTAVLPAAIPPTTVPGPPPPPSGGAAAPTTPRATLVTNVHPTPALQARYQKAGKNLKDLIKGSEAAVPKADNGTSVLCLSHALRGTCNSLCRRSDTHRGLSPAEVTRVGAFLTQVGCE
jgi:hypothetical protein